MVFQTCQIFSMPLGFGVYCSLCLKCHFPLLFQFHNTAQEQLLEESFLGWVRCRCYFPQLLCFLRSQHPLCVVWPIDLSISASILGMSVGECPLRMCIVSFGGFCTFPMLCSCLRPDCGSLIPPLGHIHWWPSYIVLGNKMGWGSSSGQICVMQGSLG